ncbi:endonuclease/exonuclease/phosphatase family protein [Arthrospiribacter ruber]|uniref:Endonuclease/exonuclease/phosphatase family protein n=1 Tax=Arthrospiribacter ruber TaxID=2487934 RepID=A0A951MF04_9BACT|nr:endonuclease/exonuclease/phosphatase family protein [Arthrospiribacter ruber]MBW3468685.1 endonuclease/exonuclease/phosphatase family protein [Arthrospiribacter ruber]
MKNPTVYIILLFSLFTSPLPGFAQKFNLATYNIRFDNPGDEGNLWQDRKPKISSLINFHEIVLFGTQEGLKNQLEDLKKDLGFDYVGSGRDDGNSMGEHSAIFYDPSRFKLLQSGDFWLSETPEKPSIGWDAAMNRICTYARFETSDENRFWVFNVHYDHVGQEARKQSSKLVLDKISANTDPGDAVIFMGDMNVTPDNEAYLTVVESKEFKDSYHESQLSPHGPEGTFNAFNWELLPDRRIDYIFINNNIKVNKYGVLSDNYGKKYPSDHFPVMIQIQL